MTLANMSLPGTFVLQPFEATEQTAKLSLTAEVSKSPTDLSITYTLSGELSLVVVPPLKLNSKRRDRLWEQTCFECFIMQSTQPSRTSPYWEFNLSPSGDWNIFALNGYRKGLKEEAAFSTLPFTANVSRSKLQLVTSIDLSHITKQAKPLQLGVSAVIALADGTETFWAIMHPGSQADFHHPGSFVISL